MVIERGAADWPAKRPRFDEQGRTADSSPTAEQMKALSVWVRVLIAVLSKHRARVPILADPRGGTRVPLQRHP
jgi:hypothetical protein